MAELFQTTKQNVGMHIKNIFNEGELKENPVVKDYFTTASDFPMVISVLPHYYLFIISIK